MACDLLRRAAQDANKCGCKLPPKEDTRAQCQGLSRLPSSCDYWALAGRRDQLFKVQYGLDSLPWADSATKKAYQLTIQNLQSDISMIEAKLKASFPKITDADLADVGYWKTQRCLLDSTGQTRHNAMTGETQKYYGRRELQEAGYQPDPLVKLAVPASLKMPQQVTGLVPVLADRLAAPEYVVLLLLLVLVVAAIALGVSANRWKKDKYLRAIRKREDRIEEYEAHDPWAKLGMPALQLDPNDKLREMVPQYEKQGYCMTQYRKKLGMPLGPQC